MNEHTAHVKLNILHEIIENIIIPWGIYVNWLMNEHTAYVKLNILHDLFVNIIISWGIDVNWLSRLY